MSTIKQVAARAGVSVGTVSNVIRGLETVTPAMRKKVEAAIRVLSYRPNLVARSLKTRQTHMLGMVVSDLANPFFAELVKGAEDAALARGYMLATFNTDDRLERERQVLEILRRRQVDGALVVTALNRADVRHLRQAQAEGLPLVCLDRVPTGLAVDTVAVDNAGGVSMAVAHLVAQGYRRIAYLGGSQSMYIARERREGYRRALRNAGFKWDPKLVCEGDFRRESGYRLGMELLSRRPRPDALFSGNILMTIGVLGAMESLGLETPRDLGLATFDYLAFMDALRPRLTAVAQPGHELGRSGANLLIDRVEKKATGKPVHRTLATELRVGESTRRVGNAS